MRIPDRFRDRTALVVASVVGVLGVVVPLPGPWPWLAAAGPLIAVVVLAIATRRRREPPPPRRDIGVRVRAWAKAVKHDDPARAHADQAVVLAGEVDGLIFRCERKIAPTPDGAPRKAAEESLRGLTDFARGPVDTYTDTASAPAGPAEWSSLADHLETVKEELRKELDDPPR
jgi:hypothetical protein